MQKISQGIYSQKRPPLRKLKKPTTDGPVQHFFKSFIHEAKETS